MTDPSVYLNDVPLRRVVLAVVCDVPAVTRADAASIARVTLGRALDVAPNRLRRGPAAHRPGTTLRHLVHDRLDDPRDVYVVSVDDLAIAVANGRVALVPLGEPEPLPIEEDEGS